MDKSGWPRRCATACAHLARQLNLGSRVQAVRCLPLLATIAMIVLPRLSVASARAEEEYARAVHLKPLAAGGSDELRIWFTDVMIQYRVSGYVVTKAGITRCLIPQGGGGLGRSRCRSARNPRRADALLGLLPLLKSTTFGDCQLQDGYEADIDAVSNGEKFSLSLDNPDACHEVFRKMSAVLADWRAP